MEPVSVLAAISLGVRITLLGAERIFLKKLERYDSIIIAGLFFLIAAIFLTPVFLVISHLDFQLLFWESRLALVSSFFYAFGFFFYVSAISLEDTSLIAPLYNSSLFWIMLLGAIFLDETVTIFRIFGGLLIFLGVFLLYGGSLREKIEAIKSSTGSIYMIIGSIFLAVGRTIDTSASRASDPRFYAFAINLYVGIYLLISGVLLGRSSDVLRSLREEPKNLILAGLTNGWSYLFLLIALQTLDLSLAEPLSLLSIFVTAFLAKLIFDEDVIKRLPAMFVILAGAVLLFL